MSDKEEQKREQNRVSPPDDGDNFKLFFKVLSDSNGDDVLLDSALETYSPQISVLESKGKDLLETIGEGAKKFFKKDKDAAAPDYLNPTNAVPTTTNEAIEHQLKRKSSNAADVVFRPQAQSVEKNSSFFKDVKYNVSIDEFNAMKKFTPEIDAGATVDYFDKSVGLKYKQTGNGGYTTFKGTLEYEPFDSTVRVTSSYHMPNCSIDGGVYLNKDNPGISAGYSQKINPKSYLRANASLFKSDAAFEVNYNKELKDGSHLSVGGYGSTYYKEAGVRLRWNFYGN